VRAEQRGNFHVLVEDEPARRRRRAGRPEPGERQIAVPAGELRLGAGREADHAVLAAHRLAVGSRDRDGARPVQVDPQPHAGQRRHRLALLRDRLAGARGADGRDRVGVGRFGVGGVVGVSPGVAGDPRELGELLARGGAVDDEGVGPFAARPLDEDAGRQRRGRDRAHRGRPRAGSAA